jgi:hypothetical protein
MKLSTITNETRESEVIYGKEKFKFRYLPGKVTEDYVTGLNPDDSDEIISVSEALAPVLDWIDVQDEDGKDLAPTLEVLQQLPMPLLSAILADITGAVFASKQAAGNRASRRAR